MTATINGSAQPGIWNDIHLFLCRLSRLGICQKWLVALALCVLTQWSVAIASICTGCVDESIVYWGFGFPTSPETDCQLYSGGSVDCFMTGAGVDAIVTSTLTNANLIDVQTGGTDTAVCVFVSSTRENQCWHLVKSGKNLSLSGLGSLTDTDHDEIVDRWDCYPNGSGSTCPTGYYATGTGMALAPSGSYASYNQKFLCAAGTYNPNTGSSSSLACLQTPSGTYSLAGAAGPTLCPAGTYNPYTGRTSSAACLQTPAGSYSAAGSASPATCTAGSYQPLAGQSSCNTSTAVLDCATYSSTSDACTDCATGYALSGGQCSLLAHVKNDFDGDSKSDVLFLNTGTGATRYWSAAAKAQAVYPGAYSTSYNYAGSGDFDGDGKADLLFTRTSDNATLIWNGAVKASASYPGAGPAGFSVAAICDANGDNKDDVVWYNATTGATRIWSGASKTASTYSGTQSSAYSLAACADFDGDGKADIFWRNAATGADQVWLSGLKSSMLYPGANTDLTVVAVGASDTDGDGKADMVWYTPSTGAVRVWSGGLKSASAYIGTGASGFTPKAIGDYDGDGKADLLWGNDTTLKTQIWPAFTKANVIYPGASPSRFSIQK